LRGVLQSPEGRALLRDAYRGRRVLVTGHTGFKGSWLTLWLDALGAEVVGFALAPATTPSMFDALGLASRCAHCLGDVRDRDAVRAVIAAHRPDYVFHLAAQPLVRRSYAQPLETVETNVMGTAHVLDAVRAESLRCAAVVVTSDKCYDNRERLWGYREDEALGGRDVYSMSKGAAELVTASYRASFFAPESLGAHGVALATARAGNVIGGGDWAEDRLVPDVIRALAAGSDVRVRNPDAVRPWQHVVEPLAGYLLLGARLAGVGGEPPAPFCEAWNFGPAPDALETARDVVEALLAEWGSGRWVRDGAASPKEAHTLRLNVEKAARRLRWVPAWPVREALARTAAWYRAHTAGASGEALRALSLAQIDAYLSPPAEDRAP
jgi:CDP-glucose 4,6-dehydratase